MAENQTQDEHTDRQVFRDRLANQHRENAQAEARAVSSASRVQQQAADQDKDFRSFRDPDRMSYHQKALRGDFGDKVKQDALDAYNRGDTLDDPNASTALGQAQFQPHGETYHQRAIRGDFGQDAQRQAQDAYGRGEELPDPVLGSSEQQQTIQGNATRSDGSQSSTQLQSSDATTLQSQGKAPGAQPAPIVEQAPVMHRGAESSTPSKTVVTQPPSSPAKTKATTVKGSTTTTKQ